MTHPNLLKLRCLIALLNEARTGELAKLNEDLGSSHHKSSSLRGYLATMIANGEY